MKLSTKARYAARAMLDLALQSEDGHTSDVPTLIKDLAKRQEISELYLEQIFTPLKTAGLIRSVRGAHGGFILAKPPSEIRLSDILQIMEGSTAPVACVDDASLCSRSSFCLTRKVWTEMKKAIDKVLESITLDDLLNQEEWQQPGACET